MLEKKIFNLEVEGNLGIVTFNVEKDSVNTWNDSALASFDEVIRELKLLEKESKVKGAIFISGKENCFLVGADLKLIESKDKKEDFINDIEKFHNAFNKLGELKIPTLAAINGPCLGGGTEFVLACTARIACDSRSTFIGLPETGVGLFPAGGGTQRLPRLIGLSAIDIIMSGKPLDANGAAATGIVDKVVDNDLLKEAKGFINEIIDEEFILSRPNHDFSNIDEVIEEARKKEMKKAKGRELPGPTAALKVMQEGIMTTLEEGLELEKEYFIDVAVSPQCKGSINTFFLKSMTDKPKKMMAKGFEPKKLNKVAILGFGSMGRGIVIDILRRMDVDVVVKDMAKAEEPGKKFVEKILTSMSKKKKIKEPVESLMSRIKFTTEYKDLKDVDLVIEAVFEDINVKKEVYRELCKSISDKCIVVSNTSFMSIKDLEKNITHPERFAGLHFFSPVWLMQLVEIIKGEKTSQNTVDNIINFTSLIRKRPLICKDNPGFVVNSVLSPYINNSLDYIEEGNSIEKVESAMINFGMPIGPIKLNDEVGIDVSYDIYKGRGIEQKTIFAMYENGRYGLKKNGKGFFEEDGSVPAEVTALIPQKEANIKTEEEIQLAILTEMVKIGKDLLERNIVDDPRFIDLGMIWGTGYPSDKGGPMKWADLIGLSEELFGEKIYK